MILGGCVRRAPGYALTARKVQTALVVLPKLQVEIDPIETEYVAVKNANVREQLHQRVIIRPCEAHLLDRRPDLSAHRGLEHHLEFSVPRAVNDNPSVLEDAAIMGQHLSNEEAIEVLFVGGSKGGAGAPFSHGHITGRSQRKRAA